MEDLKQIRISMGIHTAAAVLIGWASSVIGGLVAGALGIGVLVGCGYLSEMVTKKKGMKWWFANGIFIYLMFWLISWTVFLNI